MWLQPFIVINATDLVHFKSHFCSSDLDADLTGAGVANAVVGLNAK
jgi:hypothetical protein